jgi:hypothetical protein
MLAIPIEDRVDDDARPEQRPVLAHPPALAFIGAVLERRIQRELRNPAAAFILGVEAGEMLADDLIGGIALGGLGAGIPVGDDSVLVEHVDGIIAHALDEHAEALLAFEQRLLLVLPVGDVAGDLGKAKELTLLVADRVDDDVGPETGTVLAYPPALRLELALTRGNAQRPARQVGLEVLRREEAREMFAE